ncbi:hypothetical protein GFO_0925 [Christiangramia forsetii KT0803]|uniref:Uncharacterized protein n=1 Tax=Christiangramia forsetii (strain DSM 17595 / CGMCC 1.15422 / KT0803) TaxID=411154 RepID=A0LZV4_CHRFK|nr:hypothetical protein GFO_0925 [Christiangramia forsetii KT0803]
MFFNYKLISFSMHFAQRSPLLRLLINIPLN